MESLGFRPPQFSEDFAWLPTWAEQHVLQPSIEHGKEPQTSSAHDFEDLTLLQGNINEGKHMDASLMEETKRFHLFLSGNSSMPSSNVHSSDDVLHLSLLLSSNGYSQFSQSPVYRSQAMSDIRKDLPIHQIESSNGAVEKLCQPKTNYNSGIRDSSPLTSIPRTRKPNESQCYTNSISERGYEELSNFGMLEVTDFNSTVDLLVAASEALAIHVLMKNNLASEGMPTEAVLEAALQVKRARLEGCQAALSCQADEVDENDSLSDLDDSTMVDALEDVGLCFANNVETLICGSDISQVKDTPSETQHGFGSCTKHVENASQSIKAPDEQAALDFMLFRPANPVDLASQQLVNILKDDKVDSAAVDTLFQPQLDIMSTPAWISENGAGAEIKIYSYTDFKGQCSNGWTAKISEKLMEDNTRSILKPFVGETSFLTESADVAPDENSYVQCGSRKTNESEPSLIFKDSREKKQMENWNSQEATKHSNLSLVDCSVVPCSLLSVNSGNSLSQNRSDREVNAESSFYHAPGFVTKNFQKNIQQNCAIPSISVPEQLKSHRVRPHSGKKGGQLLASDCCEEMLSSDQNIGVSSGSDTKNNYMVTSFGSVNESMVDRNNREKPCTSSMGLKEQVEKTSYESWYHPSAKVDIKADAMPSLQHKSSLNLDATTQCIHISSGDNTFAGLKTMEKENLSKTLQKNHPLASVPQDVQVAATKRVHFLEAEVEPVNNILKQHSEHKNGSSGRSSKRLKHCVLRSENRCRKIKNCSTNCRTDRKRLMFHDMEFLLTGFPAQKEKEIERLIQIHGGLVLLDIPSPINRPKTSLTSCSCMLPVVISSRKLKTIKFLYGCAVNAFILKVMWINDSIAAGSPLLPRKYMVLPNQASPKCAKMGLSACLNEGNLIFDGLGIIPLGKHSVSRKLSMIFKHGGGQVFKTLQCLVQSLDTEKIFIGVIVAEDESSVSRHLRQCAFERNIPIMSSGWIVRSLHMGKLVSNIEEKHRPLPLTRIPKFPISLDWSQEI